MSRILSQASGVFSDIKDRLGFSQEPAHQSYERDNAYDDDYVDYDGYDQYEDDRSYVDAPGAYDSAYADDYAYRTSPAVTTRSVAGREPSRPRLVSFEDVRASTQVPERLSRNPLPERRSTSAETTHAFDRVGSDRTHQPEDAAADSVRSSGFNSLFEPSVKPERETVSSSRGYEAPAHDTTYAPTAQTSTSHGYDPHQAYEGHASHAYTPARGIKVIKPVSYDEVEQIAHALKAQDAVVLQLRNTPSNLSKRILDFAFGASSVLDASVDCIAEKVFVIARGKALSQDEITTLRNQGVF